MGSNKSKRLGFLAGLLSVFSGKVRKRELQKGEFRTSTQRIGLTFTEKIRDSFRHKWFKWR
jgi:hypothetical protein